MLISWYQETSFLTSLCPKHLLLRTFCVRDAVGFRSCMRLNPPESICGSQGTRWGCRASEGAVNLASGRTSSRLQVCDCRACMSTAYNALPPILPLPLPLPLSFSFPWVSERWPVCERHWSLSLWRAALCWIVLPFLSLFLESLALHLALRLVPISLLYLSGCHKPTEIVVFFFFKIICKVLTKSGLTRVISTMRPQIHR